MTPSLDLSAWPAGLSFALLVIYLVCRVLPDVLDIAPVTKKPKITRATVATTKQLKSS